MSFDKRDLAIMSASALVGYCQSARGGGWDAEAMKQWFLGLRARADATGKTIDAVYESNDQEGQ